MPTFSAESEAKLQTCDVRLQDVFHEVIKVVDCTVQTGHRGEEEQEKAFQEGRSKLHYPNGNHNATPSNAVDVAPYPVDWNINDPAVRVKWLELAYAVRTVAQYLGVKLRHGADWNRNGAFDDAFADWPHWEIEK